MAAALLISACGGTDDDTSDTTTDDAGTEDTDDAGDSNGDATGDADGDDDAAAGDGADLRFAMILPGPIQDADYNAIGYEAVQALGSDLGLDVAYSEQVAVADAERVAREYISDGVDVVAFHGGQFLTVVQTLSAEYTDTIFIAESSGSLDDQPDNVWNIARYFAPGFYIQGALAAARSETGTVAFLGGIDIPDYKAGANAFFAGARAIDPDVELLYTFSGDQNDAVTGRQSAEALIGQGADVLVLGVNNAIYGVAEAAEGASRPVYLTSSFTDKQSIAPDLFLNSTLWDFSGAYKEAVEGILAGQTSGEVELSPASGYITLSELYNTPDDVSEQIESLFEEIRSGEADVPVKTDEVVIP